MNRRAEQAKTANPIVWGTFDTTPLADIFAILALSRQLVGLRFSDDAGDVGTIAVKAGRNYSGKLSTARPARAI